MLRVRLFLAIGWMASAISCAAIPPEAKVVPEQVKLGGQVVTDNYWWLRKKDDPAVINYLNAENAYTDEVMAPTKPLQEKLFNEMAGRLPDVNESVPYQDGNW